MKAPEHVPKLLTNRGDKMNPIEKQLADAIRDLMYSNFSKRVLKFIGINIEDIVLRIVKMSKEYVDARLEQFQNELEKEADLKEMRKNYD